MLIPFNKPYLTGKETHYIYDAVNTGKLSGNGKYTQMCQSYLEKRYNFKKCLLTTSCTDALEMAAILLKIKQGNEVIMPSYSFVSTANAFVLRGAKIIFADSRKDHPGINEEAIEDLITPNTKAIVLVHYAGVACDMDIIMEIAARYNLFVVEDAAQAIDSYYTGKDGIRKALGSIGHLGTFSFHETKNIISGEGGMLAINNEQFIERAEIIWEKGTNRTAFFRGEVDKYNWVDIGSSYLPSEIISAFLYAQLENLELIQIKRKEIWQFYYNKLLSFASKNHFAIPKIPVYANHNAHIFYINCKNNSEREKIILHLKSKKIMAVFHYQSLHNSPYYKSTKDISGILINSDRYSECLLRLPMYYELSPTNIQYITDSIIDFYE